jgi:UDP-GlcNAc:undecaprenyl-phosphate/decaprenyl-phosphate GlcNAc-1-phosphate transferase
MQYLLPFVLAMVVTMAALPVLVRFANKWLFVDQPGERKVHTSPIPRVGGLAMACGILVAAAAMIQLQSQDRWFLVAAGVLILFGALDDRFDLDYRIKLLGQVLAVGIVIMLGDVQVRAITLDDRIALPDWISAPLTALFLVGVTNAINLADGLDGLAGGTTFLCLCAIALLSITGDPGTSTPLALAFAGAVLGFLRFNTFPASVFMGDAGSQLLGFATGVLSIRATQSLSSPVSSALPVLLLALPILDTTSVMVQRISEGRSPFSADKNHIHHKLLALGLDHHEAVMVIYVIQAALFVMAYFLRYESDLLILGVVTAFFVVTIAVLQVAARSGWRLRTRTARIRNGRVSRRFNAIFEAEMLPRLTYTAIAAGIGTYAVLIVVDAASLSWDIHALIIALLAAIVVILGIMRVAPLSLIERAMLYVTATVLVYLDALVLPSNRFVSALSWAAVAVAAVATAIRLRLMNDRRFELTPLDILVVFMALVVPNLPGSLGLPHGGALAIAKLVVVFYAIEMLINRSEDKALWVRIAAVSVLTGLTVRSSISF